MSHDLYLVVMVSVIALITGISVPALFLEKCARCGARNLLDTPRCRKCGEELGKFEE